MVTDIIDATEPLRNSLRTLSLEILSDINRTPNKAYLKIAEIVSLLDMAATLNIVSIMNVSILKKEFFELKKSIEDSTKNIFTLNKNLNLQNFFDTPESREETSSTAVSDLKKEIDLHKGHQIDIINSKGHTRIGVQKGSTLLRALSNKTIYRKTKDEFELLKKERRFNIVRIIKDMKEGATIKDILNKINIGQTGPSICSEKTLQRELISMTKDGVLNKLGEKRWSKYLLAN